MGRGLGIRSLVTLMVVTPLVAAVALMLGLLIITSRRISEELGSEVVANATADISAETERYLASAIRTSELYARRVERGTLPTKGLRAWELPMLDDLVVSRRVDSICFANMEGETTWMLRGPGGRLELGRVSGPGPNEAFEFEISPAGVVSTEPLRQYQFIASDRPWWKAAMSSPIPLWTPVYFWFGQKGGAISTGTGYTRTIKGPDGKPAGALVIDVTLEALSKFLKTLPVTEEGEVYIVDQEGLIVAASHGAVVSQAGERLELQASDGPMARAVAEHLGPPSAWTGRPPPPRARIGGEWARVQTVHIAPEPGIEWLAVVVLPEAAFMADAYAVQQRALIAALLTMAGAVALGWFVSRKLARPVQALSAHVRKIGSGDFSSRIELKAAREFETLSAELNKMSGGLRQRLELERALEVAKEVQQSLLPESDPDLTRLDVIGRARYCDSTGGDYYDFIDVRGSAHGGTLIALGDVMGHGIGSALLMATARAALRAYAEEGLPLATLLDRVNRVLAADARHGRFMTLELALIDPTAGTIRWASAGHDPIMVYHPTRDEFEELGTEDIPLGIDGDWKYREHSISGLGTDTVLLMGTDGIWETRNTAKEFYGKERMKDLIRKHRGGTANDLAVAMEADVKAFRGSAEKLDDLTYVAIKIKPEVRVAASIQEMAANPEI